MFDRLKRAAHRPARAGAVFLSYVGIISAFAFATGTAATQSRIIDKEAKTREAQLCAVVINVNRNAQFRYRTEVQNLQGTEAYLKAVEGKESALDRRIRENLPITRARVADARANVIATIPPPVCQPYADSTKIVKPTNIPEGKI